MTCIARQVCCVPILKLSIIRLIFLSSSTASNESDLVDSEEWQT